MQRQHRANLTRIVLARAADVREIGRIAALLASDAGCDDPRKGGGTVWSRELEEKMLAQVDADRLMRDVTEISRWVRLSGSQEEMQAVKYIKEQLEKDGLCTQILFHDAFISLPLSASLWVEDPPCGEVPCITHSMSASTPEEGVAGELVYVGEGKPADLKERDLVGRVALADGLAMPGRVKLLEEAGAVAQIYVNDANYHEMIVSTVWGNPSPDTVRMLPRTPVVSVVEPDGAQLKEQVTRGRVRVRMHTRVDTGWRPIPLLLAFVPGNEEASDFVLLSGHIDSWHYGAMDNAAANATMMEVGRLLAANRSFMRRSLRLAFWSGHSHGRYAGSAWYADNAWGELYEHCVVHVNVDSVGAVGATVLTEGIVMPETRQLAAQVVSAYGGQQFEGSRVGRSGDQSFVGLGVPSLWMSLSEQPPAETATARAFAHLLGGTTRSGGLGWWWHTVHDTPDKIDRDNLARDTRIYLAAVARLTCEPILPLDPVAAADDVCEFLAELEERVGRVFDLGPLHRKAALLRAWTRRLGEWIAARGEGATGAEARVANRVLKGLCRALVPVRYTRAGLFDHDPAVAVPPFPPLAVIGELAGAEPGSDEFKLRNVAAVRARNRVVHALDQACRLLDETLRLLR